MTMLTRRGLLGGLGALAATAMLARPALVRAAPASGTVADVDLAAMGVAFDGGDVTDAMLTACDIVAPQGRIWLPSGVGRVSSRLTLLNKSVAIRGRGEAATTLRWSVAGGGLLLRDTQPAGTPNKLMSSWQIDDMTIETEVAAGGTAVSAVTDLPTRSTRALGMARVAIRPAPAVGSAYWTKSVYGFNARFSRLTDLLLRGTADEIAGTNTHLHFAGQSTNLVFRGVHGMQARYGAYVEGESEGVVFEACQMVMAEIGYAVVTDGEPMAQLIGSHAACGRIPVWLRNARTSGIIGGSYVLRDYYRGTGARAVVRVDGPATRDVGITNAALLINDPAADDAAVAIDLIEGAAVTVDGTKFRDVYPASPARRTAVIVRNAMDGVRLGKSNIYTGFAAPAFVYPGARDVVID